MDKIILHHMQFYGFHGLLPEENKLGQRFNVDVELFLDLQKAGKTDDMMDSIDYGQAYELDRRIDGEDIKKVIEAVAADVAEQFLGQVALLEACSVKGSKPGPPNPGHYHSVAVEIYRERSV